MTKLLLATGNEGKMREILELLRKIKADISKPSDLDLVLHV